MFAKELVDQINSFDSESSEDGEKREFWKKVRFLLFSLRGLLQSKQFENKDINSARIKAVTLFNFLFNGVEALIDGVETGVRGVWQLEKSELSPLEQFKDGLWECKISYYSRVFLGIFLGLEQEVEAQVCFPSNLDERRISVTIKGMLPDRITNAEYRFVLYPKGCDLCDSDRERRGYNLGEIEFDDKSFSVYFFSPDFQ